MRVTEKAFDLVKLERQEAERKAADKARRAEAEQQHKRRAIDEIVRQLTHGQPDLAWLAPLVDDYLRLRDLEKARGV